MREMLAVAVGVVVLGVACTKEVEFACTDQAEASVVLTLLDEAGLPVEGAAVTYQEAGGDPEPCGEDSGGVWVCGMEVSGLLTLAVEAPGYQPQTVDVDVGADECHVITEALTVVLAAECTEELVPAVVVTVVDEAGAGVESALVTWGLAGYDMMPVECEQVDSNVWSCAEEQLGEVELSISDAGAFEDYFALIDVAHDGCHPITVDHEAVLVSIAP
jgi:hypothetical protein